MKRILAAFAVLAAGVASAQTQPVTEVGPTAGSFDVSPTGQATYTLPIWTPPGVQGVEPRLALAYTSNTSVGLLGPGWSISGFSQIARCQKTYAQDSGPAPVYLSNADVFCVDGKRLRVTSTIAYGQPDSTYQTEVADFALYKAKGVAGNGPAWFEVWTRDGLIYEYGNSSNSRAMLPNTTTPYAWSLSKVRDRDGNNMTITYSQSAGAIYPVSISYTQTPSLNATYPYTVLFNYAARDADDQGAGYIAGSPFSLQSLVTSIDVTYGGSGGTLLRKYRLTYADSPTSLRARLTAVQECAGTSGTDCKAATTFGYQNGQAGLQSTTVDVGTLPSAPRILDLNGDGRMDLLYTQGGPMTNIHYWVKFATSSGYGPPVDTGVVVTSADDVLIGDFDGTGVPDLLAPSGGIWYFYRWGFGVFSAINTNLAVDPNYLPAPNPADGRYPSFAAADINGDGRSDLIWAATYNGVSSIYTRLSLASHNDISFSTTKTLAYPILTAPDHFGGVYGNYSAIASEAPRVDFNGDHRDDVVVSHYQIGGFPTITGTARQLISQGQTFASGPAFDTQVAGFGILNFNDDACSDMSYVGQIHVSACNGATAQSLSIGSAGLIDWNGDGRTDLLTRSNNIWYVQRSLGNSFAAAVAVDMPAGLFGVRPFDHNGDGLDDAASYNPATGAFGYSLHNGTNTLPDLLSSITDGLGNTLSVNYTSYNYAKTTPLTPQQFRQSSAVIGPMHVAATVTLPDGAGGSYTNTYVYKEPLRNLQGRGFLGFRVREMTDSRNAVRHEWNYSQLFWIYSPGVLDSELIRPVTGPPIFSAQYSWALTEIEESGNVSLFAIPLWSAESFYNVADGHSAWGREVANTYDTWGNLLSRTVTTRDVYETTEHTEIVNQTGLVNDVANWCLGRPTQVQQINSHTEPGGAQLTRTSGFSWDYVKCRPLTATVEPGDTRWQLSTSYGYDSVGNVNSVTTTPVASQSQSPRTTLITWGNGRFPTEITNSAGHVIGMGWDLAKGVRTSLVDENFYTTYWQYDAFGRVQRMQRPDGTATNYVLSACNAGNFYCGAGVSDLRMQLQTIARTPANANIRSDESIVDSFGRERFQRQQTVDGSSSIVETRYDPLGRVQCRSAPYFHGAPVWFTQFEYDLRDRPTLIRRQVSESDTSIQQVHISYQDVERTVTYTDPLNRTTVTSLDLVGRVIGVLDANNAATGYEYNAFGDLLTVRDALNNLTQLTYNVRGMKTSSSDPDMGYWAYDYFPFGELKAQTSAKNQTVQFTYDALSRPLTRLEPEGTTTWTWDDGDNGIGRLTSVVSPGPYSEAYTYDHVGHMLTRNIGMQGTTYNYNYTYNPNTGLPQTLTYPASFGTPFKVQYDYDFGMLRRVKDFANPSKVFWESLAADAAHNTIDMRLGNGLQTYLTFDRASGRLDRIDTGFGDSAHQQLLYTWDKNGNLLRREDANQGSLYESFTYDNLDRLDTVRRNGVLTQDINYDAIGNITSKTGVGTYAYHPVKKHAVTTAGPNTYSYDNNGNATARNGLTLNWFSYDLPSQIAGGGYSAAFSYGADRQRYKQVHHAYPPGDAVVRTTWYAAELFEKASATLPAGTETIYRHYIEVQGRKIASHVRHNLLQAGVNTQTVWTEYVTGDHLGSADSEYYSGPTANATVADVRHSFDAFGKRRDADWDGPPDADSSFFSWVSFSNRGFTGHEHLDNVGGLIHMNGRLYDPEVGRFMSADPFVQAPFLGQSLNRYSYAMNNPLKYVDPSGFSWWDSARDWFDLRYFFWDSDGSGGGLARACQGADTYACQRAAWWSGMVSQCGMDSRCAENYRANHPPPTRTPPPVPDPDPAPDPDTSPGPQPQPELPPADAGVPGLGGGTILAGAVLPIAGRAGARNPYVLGGAAIIGGSLYALMNFSQTAAFLRQPDYMSGPEYVPPSGPLDATGSSSPGDPNQHDPNGRGQRPDNIQFGANANQVYHTFRHIDGLGIDRAAVQSAIRQDLVGRQVAVGEMYSGSVEVGGVRLQYNAYRLSEDLINVGRITGPP